MIRLLIADDEKLEREALADMVSRRFEHEVVLELAENGRKAADTAVLWGADLILMDIEMPGMSGLDAARAVLAQRPACRVIFVTAYSLFQYAHEAVHLGACDYLLKPVDPDELEASIRRAMRQIEAERKLEELARTTELSPEPETPEVPENPEEDAPEAESPEGENSQTAMVMTQVRRYLEDNYMFDLSLDSVSEILHISPAYLSAQFKKYQKMNFLDCLTELRINAAKELLADAGYADGFTTTIYCGVDQALTDYLVAIQGYLKAVGITLNIDEMETAEWRSTGIYDIPEGMILAGHGFGANLVNQQVSNFSKRAISGVGMLKECKLHPDDLDECIMNSLSASDTEEMLKYEFQTEKMIIDDYCLGYPVGLKASQVYMIAKDVNGAGFETMNEYVDYTKISFQ